MKELKAMSIQVLEARVFFKTESIGKLVIDQLAVQHFTNGIATPGHTRHAPGPLADACYAHTECAHAVPT